MLAEDFRLPKTHAKLHIKLSGKGNNKETKKMGLVLCLGEGAMKEENFPHTQKLPHGQRQSVASENIS